MVLLQVIGGLPGIPGLGSLASNAVWIAVAIALVWYYATPITIAFIILFYELLLRLDIAGSLTNVVNTIARKSFNVSILPSQSKLDSDTQAQVFKINPAINVFLNVNRAFLYMAFFLSLVTLFPFTLAITFPSIVYTYIFGFMNDIIIVLEPLFIGTVLILAALGKITDIAADIIKFISG